jgi:DNA-binding NarL/FixJ family response regulator
VSPESVLKRILIADDSGIIRALVRTSLESQSRFEICEAADGVEAIEKAKTLKPDLIVLDEGDAQDERCGSHIHSETHDAISSRNPVCDV